MPTKFQKKWLQAYLLSARQPNADVAALAFVRGDLNFDLAEHLPQLKTPTIILWGEKAPVYRCRYRTTTGRPELRSHPQIRNPARWLG